jgi:hypothetical protein
MQMKFVHLGKGLMVVILGPHFFPSSTRNHTRGGGGEREREREDDEDFIED